MRSNDQVAAALARLVLLTQLEDGSAQSFRTRAYEKAVDAIRLYPEDVADLDLRELKAIDGVGESTATKIRQFVETGHIEVLDELNAKYPDEFVAMLQVPGVGPRTAKTLLSGGETSVLKGFKSKAGKPFAARLKLIDGKVQFAFDQR